MFCVFLLNSHKEGFREMFSPWKSHWSASCRREANVKLYMSEEKLSYWAQCNECEKWRNVDNEVILDKDYCETFVCEKVRNHHFSWSILQIPKGIL